MDIEEAKGYFKQVVKQAVIDLQRHKASYVFSEEQVEAVKNTIKKDIIVEIKDGVYYLTLVKREVCENG